MGATTVTTSPNFTNNKSGDCTETITLEIYDTSTASWYTASVGTPAFVTAFTAATGAFDTYLDGVDAASPQDELAQLGHVWEHVQPEDSNTREIISRKIESLKAGCQHCCCYPWNL